MRNTCAASYVGYRLRTSTDTLGTPSNDHPTPNGELIALDA
jgi:hypothetical protein